MPGAVLSVTDFSFTAKDLSGQLAVTVLSLSLLCLWPVLAVGLPPGTWGLALGASGSRWGR